MRHRTPRSGYASFRGERLDGAALLSLVEGLSANGLVAGAYSHLLTGYIGSLSFLRAVASVAATLRAGNPGLVYGAGGCLGQRCA
jgi:pyridoxine kinase